MSFCFGFSVGTPRQSQKKQHLFLSTFVFVPLFFIAGSGMYSLESGSVFSELTGLPVAMKVKQIDISTDSSSVPVQVDVDAKHNDVIRCRWKADWIWLSSLSGKIPQEDIAGMRCVEKERTSISIRNENQKIREKVIDLTSEGYPLAVMADSIAAYDPSIAGLIVGIAKKESNWGKRTPKLHGEECFNYWGYRGYGNRGMTEDGYGCFEQPDDAVQAIGNRLIELASLHGGMTDPERMIVWKCGSSCVTHSPESVRKWISDVKLYYQQFAVL